MYAKKSTRCTGDITVIVIKVNITEHTVIIIKHYYIDNLLNVNVNTRVIMNMENYFHINRIIYAFLINNMVDYYSRLMIKYILYILKV